MRRMTRTLATSFALLLAAAGATATAHASAGSFARGGARIPVHLVNRGDADQDIKVDGRIYAVKPHDGLELKVEAGTVVYAVGKSTVHQEGEKLITITPDMQDKIVYYNCGGECPTAGS
jgi:hypothetical protein